LREILKLRREIVRKLLVAAVAMMSVAGPVFAQGVPQGMSAPVYGSRAFPGTPYEAAFSLLFSGHKSDARDASKTGANQDANNPSVPILKN
jgi:hypothetical protein